MSIKVGVMTSESVFFQERNADEVILPTSGGPISILNNHCEIMTGLDVGLLQCRMNNQWTSMLVMGGFAVAGKNKVVAVVHEAKFADEIDPEEAESTFLTTQQAYLEALNKGAGVKERVEALIAFKKAKVRYQLIKATR